MLTRIAIAAAGALGLSLVLLPAALICPADYPHLIVMLTIILASPLGTLTALSCSDVKRRFTTGAIVLRSTSSFLIFVIIYALTTIFSAGLTKIFGQFDWIVPVGCGMVMAALASEPIMRQHRRSPAITGDKNRAADNAPREGMDSLRGSRTKRRVIIAACIYTIALSLSYLIVNFPAPEALRSAMNMAPPPAVESPSPVRVAAVPKAESAAFYDQYAFSPEVVQSLWLDLDKARQVDGDGIYTLYRSLKDLVSYKKLGEWARVPIFIKGPHAHDSLNVSSKNEFGHYNKEFVLWMQNALIPAAEDSAFRDKTQHLYDRHLKATARNHYFALLKLKKQPDLVEKAKKEYLAAMAIDRSYYPEFPVERRALLFWLRRSIDGTDAEFAAGLEKLIRVYDPDFPATASSGLQ